MGNQLNDVDELSLEEWAQLYKNDPEEFERCRAQALENSIQKANPEHRAGLRILVAKFDEAAMDKTS